MGRAALKWAAIRRASTIRHAMARAGVKALRGADVGASVVEVQQWQTMHGARWPSVEQGLRLQRLLGMSDGELAMVLSNVEEAA